MADYQQQNNGQQFQRKKNALDNYGFSISMPVEGEQGKYSRLGWGLKGNNLSIKVYTGYSNDQQNRNGLIQGDLEGIQFYAFLEMVREAAYAKGEYKNKIECARYLFPQGKRSDNPIPISTVYVGKNADGLVWVSVIDNLKNERPRIQFPFGGGRFFHFKHGDGSDYTASEVSQLTAKAFYNMLSNIGSAVMTTGYTEPAPKQNNRGGGNYQSNSNYQNKSNNQGGGNQSHQGNQGASHGSSDNISDDDIPF